MSLFLTLFSKATGNKKPHQGRSRGGAGTYEAPQVGFEPTTLRLTVHRRASDRRASYGKSTTYASAASVGVSARRWSLSLFLALLVAGPLGAQPRVPLQFAQASPELAKQLEADWHRFAKQGREWAYCVTAWRIGHTADGDTVFIATVAERVKQGTRTNVTGFECVDRAGRPMPVIHSHVTGDCSPSRKDIEHAEARHSWGLVMCGPGAVTGYSGRVFTLALLGALRASITAP